MKLITDVIVFLEDYEEAYLVQGEIEIAPDKTFGVRQACPLDMPESLVLPQGYEGQDKFTPDDFSVVIGLSGYEYIIKYPYPDLMVLRKFDNAKEMD